MLKTSDRNAQKPGWIAALACVAFVVSSHAATIKIFVGGRQIETSVLETNGTIYVPLDTIAKALGVEMAIQTNQAQTAQADAPARQAQTPPQPQPQPQVSVTISPPKPLPATTIRGKLTYRNNMYQPNEPDPGAQVWLLTEPDAEAVAKQAGGTISEPIPQRQVGWDAKLTEAFARAVADGDGNFSFADVPPGRYTLIMQSKRANGLAARDRKGKMRFQKVQVNEGHTVDASFNFGPTAYRQQ